MRILFMFCLSISINLFGQSFVKPAEAGDIMSTIYTKQLMVTNTSGEEFVGEKFSSAMMSNGVITSFTMKTAEGEKMKFKAADVKELKVELKGFAKFMLSADDQSIKKSFANYFYEGKDLNYIFYQQVEVKPGKFKLMQLLNPDTDEKIQVYLDPTAQEGTFSGEDKSYFVVKGDRTFKLKKKKYDDEFANLYGDNPLMMKFLKEGQVDDKFKNFPGHIELYNQSFNW